MITTTERDRYCKEVLSIKTHILGDCVFLDEAKGVFDSVTVTGISVPVYKFHVCLSPKNYSVLRKEIEGAFQIIGGSETYVFTKPDDWDRMSFSQRDEYRFTDQYSKTGLVPVYNPQTQHYLVPKPIDKILSSREYGIAYFQQVVPPKLNGYTEGEDLTGLECTVEGRLNLLDNGHLYLQAKAINIYSHN